jgi:hypothetical protein
MIILLKKADLQFRQNQINKAKALNFSLIILNKFFIFIKIREFKKMKKKWLNN